MSDARGALVTGAGSGLGLETAVALAAAGWRVAGGVLNDEERERLQATAVERKVAVESVSMDVTQEEQVRDVVDRVHRENGLDDLVHFAGVGLRGFLEDLDMTEIRRVFEINVFGAMHVALAALPHMRRRRSGRMILTTSIAGRMASMSIGGYASSKFAVEGFAEALHQEAALFGVHVSILEPGLIATPHFTVHRNRARRAQDPASLYYAWFMRHEEIVDKILARRSFSEADVARVVRRALEARRPKLRYVVGRNARIVLAMRRHLPGEAFERLYWSAIRRLVSRAGATQPPENPPQNPSG